VQKEINGLNLFAGRSAAGSLALFRAVPKEGLLGQKQQAGLGLLG
jgi:hypothetical protein